MFYIDCGDDLHLVGASPECLIKIEEGKVYNHALAGTIRRGANSEGAWPSTYDGFTEPLLEDAKLADELVRSSKDAAEHVMCDAYASACRPSNAHAPAG
jgi:anthranilate synthase component 1